MIPILIECSLIIVGSEAMIARNNLVLAKRIFEIMEGPGIISDLMDSDKNTHHPGTINFPHRLAEAKRIHNENLIIASRLDAIQPTYYDKSAVKAVRRSSPSKGKRQAPPGGHQKRNTVDSGDIMQHSVIEESQSENKPVKRSNVLLEYTKIQRGRVLDVAVIKEPFRDSYSIFGIDIDNGQRYELKLTSEEVSTALEGDILVTSVDNVEVWMALISKVELIPVEAFSKTPLPHASVTRSSKSETKKPTKPKTLNSSKNQNNNPRRNKAVRKEANTGVSSVDSSNAVNGTDDDYSLTTGGGDEIQSNDNENYEFDGDEESAKGYTLDEYYEDNAPLSPLPSQTGFVTSAPSVKQGRSGRSNEVEEIDHDASPSNVITHTATISVNYILDAATKNIILCSSANKQHEEKVNSKKMEKNSPAFASKTNPSPYTSTTVSATATTRSYSITYKQIPSLKDKGEKNSTKNSSQHDQVKQNDINHAQLQSPTNVPLKEPRKPTEDPPTGNRRASNRHRTVTTGSNKKQSNHDLDSPKNSKKQSQYSPADKKRNNVDKKSNAVDRKKSSAVDRKRSVAVDRKKSSVVDSRRKSSMRGLSPIEMITAVPPKVAEMAVKTALKRIGGIIELLDVDFDPANM